MPPETPMERLEALATHIALNSRYPTQTSSEIMGVLGSLNYLLSELTRLRADCARKDAALDQVEAGLNCRGDPEVAHYCPNCDNSLWKVRGIVRDALSAASARGEGSGR